MTLRNRIAHPWQILRAILALTQLSSGNGSLTLEDRALKIKVWVLSQ